MGKLTKYIEQLTITQGAGRGKPLHLLPWERRFCNAIERIEGNAALTVGRGNGKTTLTAAIGVASLDGPLVVPRAETILVASSFEQARIGFVHVLEFLKASGYDLRPRKDNRWRVQDSFNAARITCRKTGSSLRCIASDPRRAHGLAPALILADEPAQWPPTTNEAMLAALRTSMGKIDGSRLIALGTRPDNPLHWFQRMLDGGAEYAQSHAANKDDPPFRASTWRKANPSLSIMPALERAIRREANDAKRDPVNLAAFRALRLNGGISDTLRSMLISVGAWTDAEGSPEAEGWRVFGVDLGATAAMSAVACAWETGRLECVAAFPREPELYERATRDGLRNCWRRQLIGLERRDAIAADRWREGELRDAMDALGLGVELVCRGQGFKDGADDVRRFRRNIIDKTVNQLPSILLRAAMSEAVTIGDPAGNEKLAKQGESGRRQKSRDDAAAAVILAVAELDRWRGDVAGTSSGLPVRVAI